jgi:predicted RNA-binding Zn ribbon-like protein
MSRDPQRAASQFFGGRACLDFANTVDWRTSDNPQELIPDYPAFLAWSVRRGTMSSRATARLKSLADADPVATARTMDGVLSLRAEISKIADALRDHRAADLTVVNAMIGQTPPQPPLLKRESAYLHDLRGDDLTEPLWPLLWSLTSVLTSTDATRIGCCQATGCGWFYVDESPNRTRLWCSSEVCGNRERVRRAYARRNKGKPQRKRAASRP